ncbi:hypothetical protein [Streptomyces sp. NPDC048111]|uniref:hypothetical protein n=1 Tax=Streptomyces sp. NPDC048111 TaxID=3365500 RepID=UPI00371B14D3
MSTTPTPGPRDGDAMSRTEPAAERTERPGAEEQVEAPAKAARPKLVFDDPLDQQSSDDTDRGWGERPASAGSAADLARFLDEKPPHHI